MELQITMRIGEIRGVMFQIRYIIFREDGEEIMNSFDENTESWVTMSNNHLTCLFGVTPTLALGMTYPMNHICYS